jgi:hypothetical protein
MVLLNVLLWMLLLMPALVVVLLRYCVAGVKCCEHAVLRGSGKLLVYWFRICTLHLADHCGLGVSTLQKAGEGSAVLSRAAAAQAQALKLRLLQSAHAADCTEHLIKDSRGLCHTHGPLPPASIMCACQLRAAAAPLKYSLSTNLNTDIV